MKSDFIWMDGELVPYDQATVHFLTPAMHYGLSVFEGIRCYEAKDGPAVFRLKPEQGVEKPLVSLVRMYRIIKRFPAYSRVDIRVNGLERSGHELATQDFLVKPCSGKHLVIQKTL